MVRYDPNFNYDTDKILEGVKKDLCQALRKVALRQGWTQRELAGYLLASEATASRICRMRTHELTLNQLFRYLALIRPSFKILIAL